MWIYIPKELRTLASLQEQGDSICLSESRLKELSASVTVNGKLAQPAYWRRAWKTEALSLLRSSLTLSNSQANSIVEKYLESLAASRVPTSASPEQEPDSMETKVASGGTTPESLLKLNLISCSSKTCRACSQPADRDLDAYVAGVIDGEGSLTVRADRNHSSYTVVMAISMATKAISVLNAVYWTYGGAIRTMDSRKPQEASVVKWQMSGTGLLCVLRRIVPFLHLKKKQAQICISLMEKKWPKYNGNQKVTEERAAAFEKAKQEVEALNQRGPMPIPQNYVAQLVGDKWMVRKGSLFGEHWETFSGPFPASGSLRNGVVYERPTLALRTGGNGSSSTPGSVTWKTPHGMGGRDASGKVGGTGGGEFAKQANAWPTPVANDDNKTPEAHLAMKQRMGERDGTNANRTAITSLAVKVQQWPSPRSEDSQECGNHPGVVDSLGGAAKLWTTPNVPNQAQAEQLFTPRFLTGLMGRDIRSIDDLTEDEVKRINEAEQLWQTPATANSKSRRAMTASSDNGRRSGGGQSSPPGLEQEALLFSGEIPEAMCGIPLPAATQKLIQSMQEDQWQTPATDSFRSRGGDRKDEMGLDQQARLLWTTPTQGNACGSNHAREGGASLNDAAAMFPTPAARDYRSESGGGSDDEALQPSERAEPARDDRAHSGRLFPPGPGDRAGWAAVLRETPWLAPAIGGRLNPIFVESLMGWPEGWTDQVGLWEDYGEFEANARKVLRVLCGQNGTQDVRQKDGRPIGISAAQVLRSEVHGDGEDPEQKVDKARLPFKGQEAFEGSLREMRYEGAPFDSSCGPGLVEQQPHEFTDPLQFVSHIASSCRRGDSEAARYAAMQVLRQDDIWPVYLQNLSDEDQAAWRSLLREEGVAIVIEAAISVYLKSGRTDRLRACGNGVVSLQGALAFATLTRRSRGNR